MSLPPGKKWVVAEGESVEVEYGDTRENLYLRHSKTAADPYWVFQRQSGSTIYVETIIRITRTNTPDLTAPLEGTGN